MKALILAFLFSGAPLLAPVNILTPQVTGTSVHGFVLTTSDGTWTNSPSFTYQWILCDSFDPACEFASTIPGATSSTYTIQIGDVGAYVKSRVTGTNSGGSAVAPSNAVFISA